MAEFQAWRVGFRPQPWEWTDWRWAGANGRFNGRWDPLDHGLYRTVYAGSSKLACYIELLAQFRPDKRLVADLAEIEEEASENEPGPVVQPGTLDLASWAGSRVAAEAKVSGEFVDVTSLATVQELRPKFLSRALAYGLSDFDVSALKSADQRLLTQEVSQFLWIRRNLDGSDYCDGVEFRSRHGDDLKLWAIFEREDDSQISKHVSEIHVHQIASNDVELLEAMRILGITPLSATEPA